jgi:DNA-binding MarR family transcriptional regulator
MQWAWRRSFPIGSRLSRKRSPGSLLLFMVQVSRAASRLEEKGLIIRTISEEDRRLRHYAVTNAGQALFQKAFGEVDAKANAILSAMSEQDRQALETGIAALHKAVKQVTEAG